MLSQSCLPLLLAAADGCLLQETNHSETEREKGFEQAYTRSSKWLMRALSWKTSRLGQE